MICQRISPHYRLLSSARNPTQLSGLWQQKIQYVGAHTSCKGRYLEWRHSTRTWYRDYLCYEKECALRCSWNGQLRQFSSLDYSLVAVAFLSQLMLQLLTDYRYLSHQNIYKLFMMDGNKICLTRKGYQLIRDQSRQLRINPISSPKDKMMSLPSLHSTITSQSNDNLGKKQHDNNKLSGLSRTLTKIQTIGVKKLTIRKQEEQLATILRQEMKQKQKYLSLLVPSLVRKTRDGKLGNLNSRYNRSRAYADRLLQNYSSQKKYGMLNNKKNNEEQGN